MDKIVFNKPVIDVIEIDNDIITTSTGNGSYNSQGFVPDPNDYEI